MNAFLKWCWLYDKILVVGLDTAAIVGLALLLRGARQKQRWETQETL